MQNVMPCPYEIRKYRLYPEYAVSPMEGKPLKSRLVKDIRETKLRNKHLVQNSRSLLYCVLTNK